MTTTIDSRAASTDAERRGLEPRRFRPRLSFGYLQDLSELVRRLAGHDLEERVHLIRSCIDTVESWRGQLCDLGVQIDDMQPTSYISPASGCCETSYCRAGSQERTMTASTFCRLVFLSTDPSDAKIELRNSFRFALADQLLTPSVANFVRQMEQQGIAGVFADGPELAQRIECVAKTANRRQPRQRDPSSP